MLGVALELRCRDLTAGWWQRPDGLPAILGAVKRLGLAEGLRYQQAGTKAPRKLESLDRWIAESTLLPTGSYELRAAAREPEARPPFEIDLEVASQSLRFLYTCWEPIADDTASELLDRMVALMQELHKILSPQGLLGPTMSIRPLGLSYPRPRPPRQSNLWAIGALVNFASRAFHERHSQGRPQELRAVLAAPIPPGCQRIEQGDLVTLRWAQRLGDSRELAACCSVQEHWLAQVLPLEVKAGYNELGDELVTPMGLQPRPPLTFYDSMYQAGYQATTVTPDGTTDDELLDEAAGWRRDGRLPDGTPLKELHLLVPNRESALRLLPEAHRRSIDKVLYLTEDRRIWDPAPPGEWLS